MIACTDCKESFDPSDSLMGYEGQCQNCWEAECDRSWWRQHNALAMARVWRVRAAAERREHGTHARYVAGCHCLICRAAHSRYNSAREKAKQAGDWNGIVSAEKSRLHLLWLSKRGIGYKVVADYADVAPSILFAVRRGTRKQIRARAERRILAVGIESVSDGTRVDAAPTWAIINSLLRDGYSKAQLARWLGYKVPALQMRRDQITARNASRVARMHLMVREGRLSR